MPKRTTRQTETPDYAMRRSNAAVVVKRRAKASLALITRPEDVAYLTGFSGEDSFLLLGRSWAALLTDGRYGEQARVECPDLEIHVRTGRMSDAVSQRVRKRRVRRLAVQADHVTLHFAERLDAALEGVELAPVTELTTALRSAKDAAEVRAVRKAIRVAQKAFRELLRGGTGAFVGRSERDLAAELEYRMKRLGASKPSFETIVAAGAHGSLPHYRPGRTRIRADQAVLIDWGALVEGYCSDLTRVVFTGRIPPQLAEIYPIVLRAQEVGIEAIREGVSAADADAAAREVVAAAGYEEAFMHGLGHGVGRAIHESPGLSRLSESRLRAGMVVTVEPGIYLPGVGGVRIEDDILVEARGARRLSTLPRSIRAMTLTRRGAEAEGRT